MKKMTKLKLLGLSLTSSFILASSITVQAVINYDYNNDGVVNSKDVAILKTNLLLKTTDVKYDINGDNKINILDYVKLKMVIATPSIPDNTDITSKFTDVNFKTEIYKLIGKTSPTPILYSDVKNIKTLDVSYKNISSLNGIEFFISLTSLYCSSNQLTNLDVSKNVALTSLNCYENQLRSLDISENKALTYLDCSYNQLTRLYSIKNTWSNDNYSQYTDSTHTTITKTLIIVITLPDNTDITSKFIDANFKTEIYTLIGKISSTPILYSDVKDIKTLDVSNKNISSLNGIEYFMSLNSLNCSSNQLISLDLSKNKALTSLSCYKNQLRTLYSDKNNWNDTCYNPQYTDSTHTTTTNDLFIIIPIEDNLDITSKFINANFKTAICNLIGKSSLAPLLYSDVKNIKTLDVSNKNISSLDGIEYFTVLTSLDCSYNPLTALDVSKNTALTSLNCSNNGLKTLDVSTNTTLTRLNCGYNQLTSLNVSMNAALSTLYCYCNKLTNLDVSKNISMVYLYCYSNQLVTLDISKNTELFELQCQYNQITTLYSIKDTWNTRHYKPQFTDSIHSQQEVNTLVITILVSDNMDITSKFTDANFKTEIYKLIGKTSPTPILYSDVKNIKTLDVSNKNISSLHGIEFFRSLTSLNCSYNKLTSLYLSDNIALTSLNCYENRITILNLSNNTALTYLECSNNQITNLYCSGNTLSAHYKYQYTDSTHTITISTLVIT